jgi:CheY-like chemotaxis protein
MADNAPASCPVMVVDDEPDIRHLLRVTLESAGYGSGPRVIT